MSKTTVSEFLRSATSALSQAGIPTARLDCLVLLEDILGTSRAHLLAHPDTILTPVKLRELNTLIVRRAEHEPLAYLRHKTEFYGREFYIDHHVLEPRPESEMIIDVLKSLNLPPSPLIVDVGTGSGALAITSKLELPQADVTGIDIDPECLKIAAKNARGYDTGIRFIHGSLLEPLLDVDWQHAALLCNLPYVPDSFQINPAAMREPRLAIFGGHDGLDVYRKLFGQLHAPVRPAHILTEALPPQHQRLAAIAAGTGYQLRRTEDFIQLFSLAA